jgi:hypothetical protein
MIIDVNTDQKLAITINSPAMLMTSIEFQRHAFYSPELTWNFESIADRSSNYPLLEPIYRYHLDGSVSL